MKCSISRGLNLHSLLRNFEFRLFTYAFLMSKIKKTRSRRCCILAYMCTQLLIIKGITIIPYGSVKHIRPSEPGAISTKNSNVKKPRLIRVFHVLGKFTVYVFAVVDCYYCFFFIFVSRRKPKRIVSLTEIFTQCTFSSKTCWATLLLRA